MAAGFNKEQLAVLVDLHKARREFDRRPSQPGVKAIDQARIKFREVFGVRPSIYAGFGK